MENILRKYSLCFVDKRIGSEYNKMMWKDIRSEGKKFLLLFLIFDSVATLVMAFQGVYTGKHATFKIAASSFYFATLAFEFFIRNCYHARFIVFSTWLLTSIAINIESNLQIINSPFLHPE